MLIAACLVVAGSVAATIPGEFFTLRRTQSIENAAPEKDYRVAGDALVLMNSRLKDSGSGTSPLPGARLKDGIWHRRENLKLDRLALARAPGSGDYLWCNHDGCRTLAHWLGAPASAQVVEVRTGAGCARRADLPTKAP